MRLFFFFKQKTAYEMRISDWSSDGCSSDLRLHQAVLHLRVDIELPRPGRRFVLLAAAGQVDFLDVELRHRGRRGRAAEAITALVDRDVARDRPARSIRNEAQDRKSTRLNSSH